MQRRLEQQMVATNKSVSLNSDDIVCRNARDKMNITLRQLHEIVYGILS